MAGTTPGTCASRFHGSDRDMRDAYLATIGGRVKRALVNHLLDRLREWDRASATGVDRFAGISQHIVERIGASYGREAEVVYPPLLHMVASAFGNMPFSVTAVPKKAGKM